MNNKRVGCFLVILLCLLANVNVAASSRLITCVEQENQSFVCLPDAVERVKNNLDKSIRIVGYSEDTNEEGMRIAAKFELQLINGLKRQGIRVNESQFHAESGGVTDRAKIEVYAD